MPHAHTDIRALPFACLELVAVWHKRYILDTCLTGLVRSHCMRTKNGANSRVVAAISTPNTICQAA
jgi:hypothetical protein